MTISEKVAYLKGLAEGLNLDVDKSKEGKLISVMIGILEEIGLSIEDLEENALALGEEIDVLSDDLADVESVVFDEDEDDGDYFEVECPNCEEPILIDDEALAAGEVQCPNCETRTRSDPIRPPSIRKCSPGTAVPGEFLCLSTSAVQVRRNFGCQDQLAGAVLIPLLGRIIDGRRCAGEVAHAQTAALDLKIDGDPEVTARPGNVEKNGEKPVLC